MMTTTISCESELDTATGVYRALIVEDQPEIGDLLAQILQPLGFQTFFAVNGVEATQLARSVKPDLLTLDLNLPVKDGHTVLRELAADSLTNCIPVIVISAYTGQLRPTNQVVGVLQKPFDVQELLDTIAIATNHS
jgi:CheY-like chemotaxis protein